MGVLNISYEKVSWHILWSSLPWDWLVACDKKLAMGTATAGHLSTMKNDEDLASWGLICLMIATFIELQSLLDCHVCPLLYVRAQHIADAH